MVLILYNIEGKTKRLKRFCLININVVFYPAFMNIIKRTEEELKRERPSLDQLEKIPRVPLVVVAENIRSLYNVGSLFRTCDGAGVEKLYLTGYTGYPPRKEIDKTALGSVESVPWEHVEDTTEVLTALKKRGYRIALLEHTSESVYYEDMTYNDPLCIVLGSEVSGTEESTLVHADLALEIPMFGIKESLNVAVACGVVVYHISLAMRRNLSL